ncbi:hypothetical protein PMIN01_12414 [Paraphaeosphaeria minitans]|uniref:Uncharacterized protein n=1 Tax=Paraphaeosphaeria minitans TaxID=565426 RepID=A0A9P6KK91_9PLEO|nr:hypothetical protein PMIN01_12414 [Paraphaeosphaeria minitans]
MRNGDIKRGKRDLAVGKRMGDDSGKACIGRLSWLNEATDEQRVTWEGGECRQIGRRRIRKGPQSRHMPMQVVETVRKPHVSSPVTAHRNEFGRRGLAGCHWSHVKTTRWCLGGENWKPGKWASGVHGLGALAVSPRWMLAARHRRLVGRDAASVGTSQRSPAGRQRGTATAPSGWQSCRGVRLE